MLLKTTRTALLTVAALDQLYATPGTCCTTCCAACWALSDMAQKDDLDDVVRRAPERTYKSARWFVPYLNRVNLTWLTAKWVTDCDHGLKEDSDSE